MEVYATHLSLSFVPTWFHRFISRRLKWVFVFRIACLRGFFKNTFRSSGTWFASKITLPIILALYLSYGCVCLMSLLRRLWIYYSEVFGLLWYGQNEILLCKRKELKFVYTKTCRESSAKVIFYEYKLLENSRHFPSLVPWACCLSAQSLLIMYFCIYC